MSKILENVGLFRAVVDSGDPIKDFYDEDDLVIAILELLDSRDSESTEAVDG
jgi:hypothetical protein